MKSEGDAAVPAHLGERGHDVAEHVEEERRARERKVPDRGEHVDHGRGGTMAMGTVVAGEDVQADRPLEVGHVEVANLLGSPARDIGEHRLGGVAERVDETDPFPERQVLGDHACK